MTQRRKSAFFAAVIFLLQAFLVALVDPGVVCNESNQFLCNNGECKHISFKCDGHPDCKDESDEDGCKAPDCEPTRYGRYCHLNCSATCEQQLCHPRSGDCTSCPAGRTGNQCEKDCPRTQYGKDCWLSCSTKCENQLCDSKSGICTSCPVGKRGEQCDQDCPSTRYGKDCKLYCSNECEQQLCNSASGACMSCPIGRMGTYCEQDCPIAQYGKDCKLRCSTKCENQLCDSISGVCTSCPVGKIGEQCDQDCPSTRHGKDCKLYCSTECDQQLCDSASGACKSCPRGRMGTYCETDCLPTQYGKDCKLSCSTNCENQLCDSISGVCTSCPVGKIGEQCDQDCPSTRYGKDCKLHCSTECDQQLCDSISGACTSCPIGRMGTHCEKDCEPTRHGKDCKLSCSNECEQQICDSMSGICTSCPVGKIGEQCEQDCPPTRHGMECKLNCSTACKQQLCHAISGICSSCPVGKTGEQCEQEILTFTVNDKKSVVVEEGSRVSFTCRVTKNTSYNTTHVLLENGFGKTSLRPANERFSIENLTCSDDSGRYTCRAVNILDPSAPQLNKTVDVNIICPIKLKDPSPDQKVRIFNATQGPNTNVSFEVSGYPPPKKFHLRQMTESQRGDVQSGNGNQGSTNARSRPISRSSFQDVDTSRYTTTFTRTIPPYGEVTVDFRDPPTEITRYLLDIINDRNKEDVTVEFVIVPATPPAASPDESQQNFILIVGFSVLGGLLLVALIVIIVYCHRHTKEETYRSMLRDVASLPGLQNHLAPRPQNAEHYVMSTMAYPCALGQPPSYSRRPENPPDYFDRSMLHQMDHHEYGTPVKCGAAVPEGLRPPTTSGCYADGFSERPDDVDEVPEYSELDEFQKSNDETDEVLSSDRIPVDEDGYETPIMNKPFR